MERKKSTRILSFALCVAMLLTMTLSDAFAESGKIAGETDPMVRVLLRRLNITDRMDIVLTGPYGLTLPNGTELFFDRGNTLSFRLMGGKLYLYYENMTAELGTDCSLNRYKPGAGQDVGFSLTNYAAFYRADLRLKVDEDIILPIATLHVEDYLQCVVPYEMSEYFPLEALKAQTVAARTYVLRRRDPKRDYDVVDTTNDQVFKGYLPGFAKCEQAIRETEGVCGFFEGNLAQCYYSASNGGYTERVESVWSVKDRYDYYAAAPDPYDLENPASTVRRTVLPKKYGKNEAGLYGLRALLAQALEKELTALGMDPAAESIHIVEIRSLTMETTPEGKATAINMEVSLMGRTRQQVKEEPSVVITPLDEDLMAVEPVITPVITPEPTPAPTPEAIYGDFVALEGTFTVQIPIFPQAESLLGMDISSNYENEIWTVVENKDSFVLEARRYGHGVGMSQRGAEWMASAYGKTYVEILNYYYPGMDLWRYEYTEEELPEAEEALSATRGPVLSPTPQPTLMPLSLEPAEGQWIATVTGIDDDSSLNLRSLPGLHGDILLRLYKHQPLLVLERCPEEGWVRVRTDYAEGYVMESFLSRE